jgi:hypothetical protein
LEDITAPSSVSASPVGYLSAGWPIRLQGGGGDRHLQPTQPVHRLGDHPLGGRRVRDVGRHDQGSTTLVGDLVGDPLQRLLVPGGPPATASSASLLEPLIRP